MIRNSKKMILRLVVLRWYPDACPLGQSFPPLFAMQIRTTPISWWAALTCTFIRSTL